MAVPPSAKARLYRPSRLQAFPRLDPGVAEVLVDVDPLYVTFVAAGRVKDRAAHDLAGQLLPVRSEQSMR